jgi:hypothetical protein
MFEYIEGWYNTCRRHSSLNYLSPVTYENTRHAEGITGQATILVSRSQHIDPVRRSGSTPRSSRCRYQTRSVNTLLLNVSVELVEL